MLTVKKCDDTTVISIQQNFPTVRAMSYTEYRTPHLLNSKAILYLQYTQTMVIKILIHSYQHSDELRTVQCCSQGQTDVTSAAAAWISIITKVCLLNVGLHILSLLKPLHKVNPGNEKVYNNFYESTSYFENQAHLSHVPWWWVLAVFQFLTLLFLMPTDGSVCWVYPKSHSITLTHSYWLLLDFTEQPDIGIETCNTNTDRAWTFFVIMCKCLLSTISSKMAPISTLIRYPPNKVWVSNTQKTSF